MTPEARAYYKRDALTTSIAVVRRRLDPAGNKEVSIQPQGDSRIVVQVPGDDDPERLKRVCCETGQLTFHRHDATVDASDAEAGLLPPGRLYVPMTASEGPGSLVLFEDPVITGDMVETASAGLNSDGAGFQINFTFDGQGCTSLRRLHARSCGRVIRDCVGWRDYLRP